MNTIIITGDNGPRQPTPTTEQLAEYHEAERARLLAQWVANGHPPEKFGYYVCQIQNPDGQGR